MKNINTILRSIRKNCPKSGSSVTLQDGVTVRVGKAPKSLNTQGYAQAIDEAGGGVRVVYEDASGKKHRPSGTFTEGQQYRDFLSDLKEDGTDSAQEPADRGANTTA